MVCSSSPRRAARTPINDDAPGKSHAGQSDQGEFMHYYQFNIGDYASHTQRLTMLEDLAYRRLLDEYYLHERPLNGCLTDVARQIGMRDNEDEVDVVLRKYFFETPEGWINKRADKEIAHFHDKAEKASKAGKASALQRTLHGRSTDVQPNIKHKPITNNHKPIENPLMSPLQAKDDPAPSPLIRLNGKAVMVEQVMEYLNLQARRNYRTKNPNGSPTAGALVIAQRLKEGYTVEQCKDVIGEKSNQWMGDEKMDQYLNPQTLFRKSNFDKYLAESEAQQ